jgi:hypothetical protein
MGVAERDSADAAAAASTPGNPVTLKPDLPWLARQVAVSGPPILGQSAPPLGTGREEKRKTKTKR